MNRNIRILFVCQSEIEVVDRVADSPAYYIQRDLKLLQSIQKLLSMRSIDQEAVVENIMDHLSGNPELLKSLQLVLVELVD